MKNLPYRLLVKSKALFNSGLAPLGGVVPEFFSVKVGRKIAEDKLILGWGIGSRAGFRFPIGGLASNLYVPAHENS